MKLKTRKDAEISMGFVSVLVLLELADLDDAIAIMSDIEDEFRLPGGEYVSSITSLIYRDP